MQRRTYTKDNLIEFVKSSKNWSELLRQCGYTNVGNNKYIKKKLDEYKIDYTHIENYVGNRNSIRYTTEELFCENSSHSGGAKLKIRIIKDFKLKLECNECKLTEWQGVPITLEVDHINGIHNDNRIENLRFLCPNCHSLTDTWRGRNKPVVEKIDNTCITCQKIISKGSLRCEPCQKISIRKVVDRPSFDELQEFLKSNTYVATGKKYGVSDNTIRKWIRSYMEEQKNDNPENLPENSIET